MAVKALTAFRYPAGNLVVSVPLASAVSVRFDDQYLQVTSIRAITGGSEFMYNPNSAQPIRCRVTQTPAQIATAFGWT